MNTSMRRGILSLMERLGLAWEGTTLLVRDVWLAGQPVRSALCRQIRRTADYPLSWSFFYVALFCLVSYWLLDRPLASWLKTHVDGDIQGFFKIVTRLGEAEYYLIPAGLVWLVLFGTSLRRLPLDMVQRLRRWSWYPAYLFLSIALSGLVSNAIKIAVGRLRPRYFFDEATYGFVPFSTKWAMNSFPSGHSQAGFAAMTALAILFPRHLALWLTIAVLVAASRVATTVHWMSDVAAGSWLGFAGAVLVARLLRRRALALTPPAL